MNKLYLSILVLLLISSGCDLDENFDQIPYVFVEIDVNLNDTDNQVLQADNGYIYLLGGYKGIILYRESPEVFRAFERASPVNPTDPCAVLDVHDSGLFIEDPCSGATFDFKGDPITSPVPYPLRQYNVFKDQNWLYIRSE